MIWKEYTYSRKIESIALFIKRMRSIFGQPLICVHCGSLDAKRYEWAQIHGAPMVASLENFLRLCKLCHLVYDRKEDTNHKISTTLKAKGIRPPSRLGMSMSDDSRFKISSAKIGRKPNNYGHCKLTDEQILSIEKRFTPSVRGRYGGNVANLAKEFDVSIVTIREIGKKSGRFSV